MNDAEAFERASQSMEKLRTSMAELAVLVQSLRDEQMMPDTLIMSSVAYGLLEAGTGRVILANTVGVAGIVLANMIQQAKEKEELLRFYEGQLLGLHDQQQEETNPHGNTDPGTDPQRQRPVGCDPETGDTGTDV